MLATSLDFRTEAERVRARREFAEWLEKWPWTHFITLATNYHGQTLRPDLLHDRLRGWDARMNWFLYGPKWAKRPDTRLFAAYFLEKPTAHPHWHGLIMLDEQDPKLRLQQGTMLSSKGSAIWERLTPGGTIDAKLVYDREGVTNYVSKELGCGIIRILRCAPRV